MTSSADSNQSPPSPSGSSLPRDRAGLGGEVFIASRQHLVVLHVEIPSWAQFTLFTAPLSEPHQPTHRTARPSQKKCIPAGKVGIKGEIFPSQFNLQASPTIDIIPPITSWPFLFYHLLRIPFPYLLACLPALDPSEFRSSNCFKSHDDVPIDVFLEFEFNTLGSDVCLASRGQPPNPVSNMSTLHLSNSRLINNRSLFLQGRLSKPQTRPYQTQRR